MKNMICSEEKTLLDALILMRHSKKNILFVIKENKKLCGVLSLGDIILLLLRDHGFDTKVSKILRPDYHVVTRKDNHARYLAKLSPEVKIVPVIDAQGRVVDYIESQKKVSTRVPMSEPDLYGEELRYVLKAFLSTWISSTGEYIQKFEEEFSRFCDTRYGIATSNGTTALHLALVALGIGKGDEVIVPDLTFAASINTIIHAGATPVIVDIEKDHWTIDPHEIEKAITSRTRAIMPVHIYGQPCNMDAIMKIARKHRLFVVEDAAEAHGAQFGKRTVGSFGDVGCFSFYANKVITTGEGGMCVTNSKKLHDKMKLLRDHGMSKKKKYWHDEAGFNYRMTNIQAAIGCAQLERIEATLARNQRLNKRYEELLSDLGCLEFQKTVAPRTRITWLVSALLTNGKRDLFLRKLLENNVDARPFFYPLSTMPLYKKYTFSNANSLAVSRQGISLPTNFNVSDDDILRIKSILKRHIV